MNDSSSGQASKGSGLAQHLWRRYVVSPGAISTSVAQRLMRRADWSVSRLPLLTELQRRLPPEALSNAEAVISAPAETDVEMSTRDIRVQGAVDDMVERAEDRTPKLESLLAPAPFERHSAPVITPKVERALTGESLPLQRQAIQDGQLPTGAHAETRMTTDPVQRPATSLESARSGPASAESGENVNAPRLQPPVYRVVRSGPAGTADLVSRSDPASAEDAIERAESVERVSIRANQSPSASALPEGRSTPAISPRVERASTGEGLPLRRQATHDMQLPEEAPAEARSATHAVLFSRPLLQRALSGPEQTTHRASLLTKPAQFDEGAAMDRTGDAAASPLLFPARPADRVDRSGTSRVWPTLTNPLGRPFLARATESSQDSVTDTTRAQSPEPVAPKPVHGQTDQMDVQELAEQVSRILLRQWVAERERRGIGQWH